MDNGLSYIVTPRFGTHFLEVHVHACMCHHLIGRRSIEEKLYSIFISFFLEERKGTLSRRFARGCSLSLGRLVSWNPFACGGRNGNVWESASRKNRVARWKVSRWGFRPPWSSPNCGRGEVSWVSTLSLAPFFSLFLFVYSGRAGSPHTWREEERGGSLILRCQGGRRRPQVEATDALVIQLTPCRQSVLAVMLAKAGVSAGFTYYWIWTNDSRRMKAIL